MRQLEKTMSVHPPVQGCDLLRSQGQWGGYWQGLGSESRTFSLLCLTSTFFLQILPGPPPSHVQPFGLFSIVVYQLLASRPIICGLLKTIFQIQVQSYEIFHFELDIYMVLNHIETHKKHVFPQNSSKRKKKKKTFNKCWCAPGVHSDPISSRIRMAQGATPSVDLLSMGHEITFEYWLTGYSTCMVLASQSGQR